MASHFIAPSLGFSVDANAAATAPFFVCVGVLRRKFMPSLAVSLSPTLFPRLLYNMSRDWGVKLFRGSYLVNRQASRNPLSDRFRRDAYLLREFVRGNDIPPQIYKERPSRIALLLLRGGPLKIIRGVVSVVVQPIKGMSRSWLLPHIRSEKPEVMPSLTYANPSTSISEIIRCVRFLAPAEHIAPSVIKWVVFFKHAFTIGRNTVTVKDEP